MENVFIIANKLAQKLSLKIDLGRDIGQKLYWDIGEEETVKTEMELITERLDEIKSSNEWLRHHFQW